MKLLLKQLLIPSKRLVYMEFTKTALLHFHLLNHLNYSTQYLEVMKLTKTTPFPLNY